MPLLAQSDSAARAPRTAPGSERSGAVFGRLDRDADRAGDPRARRAAALDKTPAATRQVAHRSREHVVARRPRIEVDRAEREQVVERFLAALRIGECQVLLDVLAPDIVLVPDGGGEVTAVRCSVVGSSRLAGLLSRFNTVAPIAEIGTV